MRRMAAVEAKNRFGVLLDTARREPVAIEKHGKPVAVMVSAEDFEELEALRLARLRAEIQKGLDDAAAGRIVDGEIAFREVLDRLSD